jgi:hypothetical protein
MHGTSFLALAESFFLPRGIRNASDARLSRSSIGLPVSGFRIAIALYFVPFMTRGILG